MRNILLPLIIMTFLLSSCAERREADRRATPPKSPGLLTTMSKGGPGAGFRALYQRKYDNIDSMVCTWFEIDSVDGAVIKFTEYRYGGVEKCESYTPENPTKFTVNLAMSTFQVDVPGPSLNVPYIYFNWAAADEIRGEYKFNILGVAINTVEFSAHPGQPASFLQYVAEEGILNSVLIRYVFRVAPLDGPQNFVQQLVGYHTP